MKEYDLAVIGGGPGGYVAAIRAAKLKRSVVLFEEKELGGTCLNRGCIPTKAMLHAAETYHEVQNAASVGVCTEAVSLDFTQVASYRDGVVKKLRGGVTALLKKNGVTVISEKAHLTDGNTVEAGNESYHVKAIILATGSAPARVPIPGADKEGVTDSDGVLSLTFCPESIILIGGGVIGVEFATFFSSIGKKVTIIEMLPSILNGMDPEICKAEQKILEKSGVTIVTGAKVLSIEDGLVCHYEKDKTEFAAEGQLVVLAAGRKPNTGELGLECAGIRTTERGFIETDSHMRTNIPNIYAIGDITGKAALAHVASAQGIVAAHNACGEEKVMRYDIIPSCIYTNPEIASVGLTEEKAIAAGHRVRIGTFPVSGNGRSMIMGISDGFVKLLTDESSGELLGCHMMAPRATDLIGEIAVSMHAEATVEELSDTIHAHPTVSEILMEASHDTEKLSTHKI